VSRSLVSPLTITASGLTSERLTFEGEHYHYDDVPMELHPLQKPYPPLWYATSNLETVAWAAEHNMHMAGLGPAETYRPFVERYRATWDAHAHEPRKLNPHVAKPRIAINRQVVIADTDQEAEAIVRAVHPRWARSFVKLWVEHGDASFAQRVNLDAALRAETILCGSPPRVRDLVAHVIETTGVDHVVACFAWGDLAFDQSLRSLRLFADHVMPAFAR